MKFFGVLLFSFSLVCCGVAHHGSELASVGSPSDIKIRDMIAAEKSLGDLFAKSYLIVEFSRAGCGGCLDLANEINKDQDFQKLIANGKCDYRVITPKNGLKRWANVIGAESYVAKRSVEPIDMEYADVSQALGYKLMSVPVMYMVDRNWGIVKADEMTDADGEIKNHKSPELANFCK